MVDWLVRYPALSWRYEYPPPREGREQSPSRDHFLFPDQSSFAKALHFVMCSMEVVCLPVTLYAALVINADRRSQMG